MCLVDIFLPGCYRTRNVAMECRIYIDWSRRLWRISMRCTNEHRLFLPCKSKYSFVWQVFFVNCGIHWTRKLISREIRYSRYRNLLWVFHNLIEPRNSFRFEPRNVTSNLQKPYGLRCLYGYNNVLLRAAVLAVNSYAKIERTLPVEKRMIQ
jgi:hypothetical protein